MENKYRYVLGSFRLRDTKVLDCMAKIAYNRDLVSPQRILIDTGLSYNVDHIIYQCSQRNFDVMSKFGVDHIKGFHQHLTNHLRFLGVDYLEYALVHFYEPNWEELVKLMKNDSRIHNVGVSNFNVSQITEYYNTFGEYPAANQIEFSIMYHDLELVKFCREHDIEVFGYGVLGGIHNSKLAIREYSLEGLIGFAVENGVTPIFRTDSFQHMWKNFVAYEKCLRGDIKLDVEITSGNYNYELSAEVKDPRALNKFKYDNPSCAAKVKVNGVSILTLDQTNVEFEKCKIIRQKLTEVDKHFLNTYEEVPRDFMMITDYLVREKFSHDPTNIVSTSDDTIVFKDWKGNKTKLVSYVMLDDEDHMIKSGSCHARVFRKEIQL
jgi:hypothetical protein